MADTTREAYRIVLNDILNNGCGMFLGNYDAKNGSAEFMHGISTVMEHIAYSICDEQGDDFSNLFIKNMIASEQKAQGIKCYKCAELDGCYKGQHGGKKKCKCFRQKGIDKTSKKCYNNNRKRGNDYERIKRKRKGNVKGYHRGNERMWYVRGSV